MYTYAIGSTLLVSNGITYLLISGRLSLGVSIPGEFVYTYAVGSAPPFFTISPSPLPLLNGSFRFDNEGLTFPLQSSTHMLLAVPLLLPYSGSYFRVNTSFCPHALLAATSALRLPLHVSQHIPDWYLLNGSPRNPHNWCHPTHCYIPIPTFLFP